jgi:hypothetical protein
LSSFIRSAVVALIVAAFLIALENVLTIRLFPHLPRLPTDFSRTYLQREFNTIEMGPPQTIFIGDSVLWGYGIKGDATAVARLKARGCRCVNLAFKSGNPPNDFFTARLLLAANIRPRIVVIDVNQAVLNESDAYYQSLHPTIAEMSAPFISASDRTRLSVPDAPGKTQQQVDRILSRISSLYAMRADIREALGGNDDKSLNLRMTTELFEGTYDLSPLTESNVGVHYLEQTVALLHRDNIPVLAFLTPTNHALLHRYIDNAHYARNSDFLKRILRQRGAVVMDFDRALPGAEFIDNAHLTSEGQRRLAALLAEALRKVRPLKG